MSLASSFDGLNAASIEVNIVLKLFLTDVDKLKGTLFSVNEGTVVGDILFTDKLLP